MYFHWRLSIAAFILLFTLFKATGLDLPSLWSDHMVLQQKSDVLLWGTSKKGEHIDIITSWDSREYKTRAQPDGSWQLKVRTPSAGGPYQIEINADSSIILKDILIGEVWVCSGQSNMEMPMKGYASQPVLGSNDAILNSANNNIRYFNVERKASLSKETDCKGEWKISNPENVPEFSAVAYFFGKNLNKVMDVPIGLVHASWQGSPIDSWVDSITLKSLSDEPIIDQASNTVNRRTPNALFNGMINPLLNYTIKGAIWYQGESDRCSPAKYQRFFPAMIRSWRSLWKSNFSFYYVQIAPFRFKEDCNMAWIREVQLKSMDIVDNTGMVVTMDIGDHDTVHPPDKQTVGNRLAYWALSETYDIAGIGYCGPIFKSMEIRKEIAELRFDYAENGFSSFGKTISGFEIAGEDRVFYPASASIAVKSNCIEVKSDSVSKPVAVRYCWQNYAEGTLYNTAGLPASPFRTDRWKEY